MISDQAGAQNSEKAEIGSETWVAVHMDEGVGVHMLEVDMDRGRRL